MRTSLAVAVLLLLAGTGCTDGDAAVEPAPGIQLPGDPDAVVLRWSVPVGNGVAPGGTSRLVITAGGAVYQAVAGGPQGLMAGPPMPALSDYVTRRLDADGLQRVMARAGALGLLDTVPEYVDVGITDQASTELVLATAAGERTHLAYALASPGDESDDARRDLARFVQELSDLEQLAGPGLSEPSPFEPSTYSVWVEPIEGVVADGPTWTSSVELADVNECVAVAAAEVAAVADGASVFQVDDGVVDYHLRVAPVLPVDDACRP